MFMVNYYLTRDASVTDGFDVDYVPVPRELAMYLNSWIHEEVSHDFITTDIGLEFDVDVNIDLDKFKRALLRTFLKEHGYNFEVL